MKLRLGSLFVVSPVKLVSHAKPTTVSVAAAPAPKPLHPKWLKKPRVV